MRFRERLYRFMQGRYGWDQLNRTLTWTAVISAALSVFFAIFRLRWAMILRVVFQVLAWGLLLWVYLRAMSRNTVRRMAENARFTRFTNRLFSHFRLRKRQFCNSKTHVFRRCHNCGSTLRLPRRRGKHTTRCPKCGNRMPVIILFGKK